MHWDLEAARPVTVSPSLASEPHTRELSGPEPAPAGPSQAREEGVETPERNRPGGAGRGGRGGGEPSEAGKKLGVPSPTAFLPLPPPPDPSSGDEAVSSRQSPRSRAHLSKSGGGGGAGGPWGGSRQRLSAGGGVWPRWGRARPLTPAATEHPTALGAAGCRGGRAGAPEAAAPLLRGQDRTLGASPLPGQQGGREGGRGDGGQAAGRPGLRTELARAWPGPGRGEAGPRKRLTLN